MAYIDFNGTKIVDDPDLGPLPFRKGIYLFPADNDTLRQCGEWVLTEIDYIGRAKFSAASNSAHYTFKVDWTLSLRFKHVALGTAYMVSHPNRIHLYPLEPGRDHNVQIPVSDTKAQERLGSYWVSDAVSTVPYMGFEDRQRWFRYVEGCPMPENAPREYWTEFRERLAAYDNMQALGSRI